MKSIYSPPYQALIAWLRAQRLAKGLTLREVGARVKRPHSWVGKIETGERRLDVAEYVTLCRAIEAEADRGIAIVESALGTYKPAAPANLKAADARSTYATAHRPDRA